MLKVGLTGGIGSGKSTVAHLFAQKGIPIIDADQIAYDLTQPGHPAFNDIVTHFGQEILTAEGTLNRQQLKKMTFTHPDERQWLESLLHPLIRKTMKKQITTTHSVYCILVIPLLLETKASLALVDRVLVVDASEAQQIARAKKRDQLDEGFIKKIMAAQVSREMRLAKADDVIVNDGDKATLKKQVDALDKKYKNL